MDATPCDTIAVPKPKRRWFQFSLKGLFVLVFVLCVPLAWFAAKLHHKRRERAALAAFGLSPVNARFNYDWNLQELAGPPGPRWLCAIFGDDLFANVVLLESNDHYVTDADLALLEALPMLQHLFINCGKISDRGLEHIGRRRELRNLRLLCVPIKDVGLRHLERLTDLRGLQIMGHICTLSDAGLPHFKHLKKLEVLKLGPHDFTAAGIAELQANLPDCQITFFTQTKTLRPDRAGGKTRAFPVMRADGKW